MTKNNAAQSDRLDFRKHGEFCFCDSCNGFAKWCKVLKTEQPAWKKKVLQESKVASKKAAKSKKS